MERIQTGIRIEKRTLKVLRALADYLDLSLGDLVEGIVLHALEGKAPFSPETLAQVTKLRAVYGLSLTAKDSHQMTEPGTGDGALVARSAEPVDESAPARSLLVSFILALRIAPRRVYRNVIAMCLSVLTRSTPISRSQ